MKNTFVTIFLIIIAFSLGLSVDKSKIKINKNSEEPVVEVPVVENKKTSSEYKSPFGFSFVYGESFSLENSTIVLPGGDRVASIAAVRYVKQQKCGESGLSQHCRAFLENPAIAFGVIDDSVESLKTNQLKDVAQFSEDIEIAGKKGIQYYMGVEGEGVMTIVLPLKQNQSFIIQYTFDEMYDQIQKSPEILGSKEQKMAVDEILSSLKF